MTTRELKQSIASSFIFLRQQVNFHFIVLKYVDCKQRGLFLAYNILYIYTTAMAALCIVLWQYAKTAIEWMCKNGWCYRHRCILSVSIQYFTRTHTHWHWLWIPPDAPERISLSNIWPHWRPLSTYFIYMVFVGHLLMNDQMLFLHLSIHPSMFCTAFPTQGHGKTGAYPKGLTAQGRRHPGLSKCFLFDKEFCPHHKFCKSTFISDFSHFSCSTVSMKVIRYTLHEILRPVESNLSLELN